MNEVPTSQGKTERPSGQILPAARSVEPGNERLWAPADNEPEVTEGDGG